jgi:hypothetical protein
MRLRYPLARLAAAFVECGTDRSILDPLCGGRRRRRLDRKAKRLGAKLLLEPREGPTGWRSVVVTPAGGEVAMWQAKL